jgi:single-strand DNA-binding protein
MTAVTIIGNIATEPELRFTPTGKAVASFTIAENQRVKQADGTWADGDSTFWRCSLWDRAAENLVESLTRGTRVIAHGEAKQRSFEAKEGEKRSVIEVTVQEIGPSIRWATTKVERQAANGVAKKPADDPWSTAAPATDEPPF